MKETRNRKKEKEYPPGDMKKGEQVPPLLFSKIKINFVPTTGLFIFFLSFSFFPTTDWLFPFINQSFLFFVLYHTNRQKLAQQRRRNKLLMFFQHRINNTVYFIGRRFQIKRFDHTAIKNRKRMTCRAQNAA